MFFTCRSDGAVVSTSASSCAISHQIVARAAVYVFPEALQDRTATCRLSLRALSILRCFAHGFSPSQCSTNATGFLMDFREVFGLGYCCCDRVLVDACVVGFWDFTVFVSRRLLRRLASTFVLSTV